MKYFIGWDVGAWHCKEKSKEDKSQDAIAILDEGRNLIGGIWEGNLKDHILKAVKEVEPKNRVEYFLITLFGKEITNSEKEFDSKNEFFIAIDTPLGWTKAFRELLIMWSYDIGNQVLDLGKVGSKNNNPILTRQTEKRFGKSLSAIQDQIGSQSTKAMYLLSSFKPNRKSTGVWETTSPNLTIIETYPAPCMRSLAFIEHMKGINLDKIQISSADKFDALVCANLAWCHHHTNSGLSPVQIDSPSDKIDPAEGWIFAPTTFLDSKFGISYPELIGGDKGLSVLLSEIQINIFLSAKRTARNEQLELINQWASNNKVLLSCFFNNYGKPCLKRLSERIEELDNAKSGPTSDSQRKKLEKKRKFFVKQHEKLTTLMEKLETFNRGQ